jgi:SpoIID/LytB domain protein
MPRRLHRSRTLLALLALTAGLVVGVLPVDLPGGPKVATAAADTTFTFDGGGWGHGAGMSQYGLLGGSKAGRTAAEMLAHYYQGTTIQPIDVPSRITNLRVRLLQRASVFVTPTGTLRWYLNGTQCAQSPANEPVQILATGGGGLGIRGLNGTGPIDCPAGPGATLVVDYGATPTNPGSPMRVSDTGCANGGCRYWWGNLAVRAAGDTLNFAVEQLSMEHYLRGLAEVSSSWPAAALQAQAIAGRSYAEYQALHRRSPAPDPGYDLWASTLDQAYTGYEKEAGASGNLWVAAVDATAHLISTYANQVIQAFYSSSSGGYTENSEIVFAEARPYLKGVPDPWDADPANPNAAWTRSYSGTELGSWVAARYGTSIGPIIDIVISGTVGVSGRIDKANVLLAGASGSRNVTGAEFRRMVNAYAGSARSLLSTKVSLRSAAPFGAFDASRRAPGGVRVMGWAIDPSTPDPIDVHVYVDGAGAAVLPANQSRPDVGDAYPAWGDNHGFSGIAPVPAGSHTVCVYAVGATRSALLSCRGVSVTTNPIGSLDAASGTLGRITMSGWAIDPDTAAVIDVHVYVDGVGAAVLPANRSRPDVGRAYPDYGAGHGWAASIAASEGTHNACAYAINVGAGAHTLLGCRSITVRHTPFGAVDSAVRTTGGIRVRGWAIDPDTTAPIDVHVYVDGIGAGVQTASRSRPDVGAAVPPYGSAHGYDLTVPAAGSARTVCVYAINVGPGSNSLLACRSV